MARKTKELTITDEGRDKGKRFLLTEWSAYEGDRWANRCILALINAGANISEDAAKLGIAGLVAVGLPAITQLRDEVAQPLLDEMLKCVKYIHADNIPPQPIYAGDACQIEEVKTFWTIRGEVFELVSGFSLAAALQTTA